MVSGLPYDGGSVLEMVRGVRLAANVPSVAAAAPWSNADQGDRLCLLLHRHYLLSLCRDLAHVPSYRGCEATVEKTDSIMSTLPVFGLSVEGQV